jgi:hypothetical protein
MLTKELELGILDLNDGKKKVMKLREEEICTQGFRIDLDGKIVRGVPHRTQVDCHRFCYTDTCDYI